MTPEENARQEIDRPRTEAGWVVQDFDYASFSQRGGLGRVAQLFGDRLPSLLDELNQQLVA